MTSLNSTSPPLNRIPQVAGYHRIGRIALLSELGRGGFGVVYHGVHVDLEVSRAVKVFNPSADLPPELIADFVERFKKEAKIAAQGGPGIVSVNEIGECYGCHYFVMDFAAGGSVADAMASGPLELGVACAVVLAASQALARAHENGYVHRDVKPQNLLLTAEGEVLVADFGIAKAMPTSGATHNNTGLYTPGYAAPEQIVGGALTPRADVYSLGITLGTLLTGDSRFAELMRHDPGQVPALELPSELVEIILKATEPVAADRFPSAVDLAEALRPFATETIQLPSEKPSKQPWPSEEQFAALRAGPTDIAEEEVPSTGEPKKGLWKALYNFGSLLIILLGAGLIALLIWASSALKDLYNDQPEWLLNAREKAPAWLADWTAPSCVDLDWAQPGKRARRDPKTGLPSVVVDNNTGIELALIPAGTYRRGAGPDREGLENARPQHSVTITKAFYLGRHEVTQGQWIGVMGANPSAVIGPDERPVENVSWAKAREFCSKSGSDFRLPTEAEWEYACRAGTTTRYGFGHTIGNKQASFHRMTVPVGGRESNDWGLQDMHGNVAEWCADTWSADAYAQYRDGAIDPVESDPKTTSHVIRGGHWQRQSDAAWSSAARKEGKEGGPRSRIGFYGFRVARTP